MSNLLLINELNEYYYILIYMVVCFFVGILLLSISFIFLHYGSDEEKRSIYECGYSPFSDARMRFEVRFFLVAILFIVMDFELSFLLPWVMSFSYIESYGFYIMVVFLLILTVGFILEWLKGALEW